MRLVSFRRDDQISYGTVEDDRRVVEVDAQFRRQYPTLQSAIEAGVVSKIKPDENSFDLNAITFAPPVARPEKIICVGVNYKLHLIETGRSETEYPVLFTRFSNTLIAHEGHIVRPRASEKLDFEGELAVIIGRAGRHVKESDALAHVAGYSCFNDATLRDWQSHTHQFTPGKNFVATGGFGPWLVTSDELSDPTQLTLTTKLNGEEMQRTTTDQMIFSIPRLISYISTFTQLAPGDVIATGTPGGVGAKRQPPVFMKAGDTVEVEISGIGTLRNAVVDEE